MMLRRGVTIMNHRRQMSLIVRRAQIRRAAANRRDASTGPAGRHPYLRLVVSNSFDDRMKAGSDHDGGSLSFE
jgi:hypothetical protein